MMISQGMVTGISIGAAIMAGALLKTWARSRKSTGKIDTQGWTVLTPVAVAYPLAFLFPAAFLMLVIVSVVDKEPLDASQTTIAVVIFLLVGLVAAYGLWSTFGRRVAWKEGSVRLSRWFLPDRHWRMADAREVTYSDMLGFRVTFRDGSRLSFSSYENGASELADQLRNNASQANAVSD